MPSKKVKELMYLLAEALEEEEKVDLGHRIFGGPDGVPVGSVVRFRRNFGGRHTFTYVGVYVERCQGDKKWFITAQGKTVFTHEQLVEHHLMPSLQEGFAVRRTGRDAEKFELWASPSQLTHGFRRHM